VCVCAYTISPSHIATVERGMANILTSVLPLHCCRACGALQPMIISAHRGKNGLAQGLTRNNGAEYVFAKA
jgi:hypothetical protein